MPIAPDWFQRELRLIHPGLEARWLKGDKKWAIFQDDQLNRLVEDKNKNPLPLDRRTLRKIEVDFFFTQNPKALEAFLEGDHFALLAHTDRGMEGVIDYITEDFVTRED